jgi:hypothetical protein
MSPLMKTRLIALAAVELAIILTVYFGGANPAIFLAVTVGLPLLALTIIAPIVFLIRSNRASAQERPPSNSK